MSFAHSSVTGTEIPRSAFPGIPVHLDRASAEGIWKGVCSSEANYYEGVKSNPPKFQDHIDMPGFDVIRHQSYTEVRSRRPHASSFNSNINQATAQSNRNNDSIDKLLADMRSRTDGNGNLTLNLGVAIGGHPETKVLNPNSAKMGDDGFMQGISSGTNYASAVGPNCTNHQLLLSSDVDKIQYGSQNNPTYNDVTGNRRRIKQLQKVVPQVIHHSLRRDTQFLKYPSVPNNSLACTRDFNMPAPSATFGDSEQRHPTVRFEPIVKTYEGRLAPPSVTIRAPRHRRSESQREFNARMNRLAAVGAPKTRAQARDIPCTNILHRCVQSVPDLLSQH